MMPQVVSVRVKRMDTRPIRIWIPVLPALLLLSPLVVLAVLGAVVACVVFHVNVTRALRAGWRIFAALPGAHFSIEQGHTAVLVAIR